MNSGRRDKILLAKLDLSAADLLAVSLSSPFRGALQLNISDSFLRARY